MYNKHMLTLKVTSVTVVTFLIKNLFKEKGFKSKRLQRTVAFV